MRKKKIAHYGIQRSGTNYLKEIVRQSYHVEFIDQQIGRKNPAHKHFRLYDNKKIIARPKYKNNLIFPSFEEFIDFFDKENRPDGCLVISKDPYSWYLSYKKWGRKNKWQPLPQSAILEYNEFYRKWLKFDHQSEKVMMIRYIDLLERPDQVMDRIGDQLDLQVKNQEQDKMNIRKVPHSHYFTDRKKKYYVNGGYLKKLDENEIQLINRQLDRDIVKELGYKFYF